MRASFNTVNCRHARFPPCRSWHGCAQAAFMCRRLCVFFVVVMGLDCAFVGLSQPPGLSSMLIRFYHHRLPGGQQIDSWRGMAASACRLQRVFLLAEAKQAGRDMALFMDGDMFNAEIAPVISACETKGRLVERRLYANTFNLERWADRLKNANIEPCLRHNIEETLIRDIEDAIQKSEVDVAIAASFTVLDILLKRFSSMRTRLHFVIFPHSQTSPCNLMRIKGFEQAGASIVRCPVEASPGRKKNTVTIYMQGMEAEMLLKPPTLATVDDKDVHELATALTELGYLQTERAITLKAVAGAAASFFHANMLGTLMLFPYPNAIEQALGILRGKAVSMWKRNDDGLVFVAPVGRCRNRKKYGGAEAAELMSGGGPFLLCDSPNLVSDVLISMGYFKNDGSMPAGTLSNAMKLFVQLNQRYFRVLRVDISGEDQGLESRLARLFRDSELTHWKIPYPDSAVRKALHRHGYLSKIASSQSEVARAMCSSLRDSGVTAQPDRYYWSLVAEYVMVNDVIKHPMYRANTSPEKQFQ
eukprot:TRINITY_DN46654_c0_g1_i1.p1 TRINITY_DN46654_c0_g1~~TRINITY_DN46654_c0_g1_i1.p1  ORF type:complete len:531 (-),score=51.20 TRINITY_DN46654_c0_g1_i1:313-1905(-)